MYKEIEPLIPNTICEVSEANGKASYIRIRPAEGYKLHTNTLDEPVFDEETMAETGKKKLGFTKVYTTAFANYDFEKNPREIYAVPDDYEAIVDVGGNNSEIEEKAKAYDILMGVDE